MRRAETEPRSECEGGTRMQRSEAKTGHCTLEIARIWTGGCRRPEIPERGLGESKMLSQQRRDHGEFAGANRCPRPICVLGCR
jgi:hypothetical protein